MNYNILITTVIRKIRPNFIGVLDDASVATSIATFDNQELASRIVKEINEANKHNSNTFSQTAKELW
jgi:hypothetical protein